LLTFSDDPKHVYKLNMWKKLVHKIRHG